MVRFTVSTSHPKMILEVDQELFPCNIFLMDTGSRQDGGSDGESGLKTSSMESSRHDCIFDKARVSS